ncbi:MAG: hypothetical protein K1X89_21000 [Myxococcaceae bacterium]|nr:hypothetical protein [Myxococcaceae bacterium]
MLPDPPFINPCALAPDTPFAPDASFTTTPIAVLGRPVDVSLRLMGCGLIDPAEFKVQVAVHDEQEHQVPAEVVAQSVHGSELTATVRFTPTRLEPHDVQVRFEPGFGHLQRLVPVAEDHADAGRRSIPLPAGLWCDGVDLLASGAAVCRTPDAGLVVVRDGGEVQRLETPGLRTWVRGDELWLGDTFTLSLRVDRGAGPLELLGKQTLGKGIAWVVPTGPGEALVARFDPRVNEAGGEFGPGLVSPVTFDAGTAAPPPWTLDFAQVGAAATLVGTELWTGNGVGTCRGALDAGTRTCVTGRLIGLDDEAAWWAPSTSMTLTRALLGAPDAGEAKVTLPAGWAPVTGPTPMSPPPAPPRGTPWASRLFWADDTFLFRPDGSALVLEWYGPRLTPLQVHQRETLLQDQLTGALWLVERR